MLLKGINDEDFVNYKLPAMFIACHSCTFKCDKMCGKQVCQNSALANSPNIEVDVKSLVNRYITNTISKSVVFGGLEPFDDIENVLLFIDTLRKVNNDNVIIYTGYTEEEILTNFSDYFHRLSQYTNIIIKYGRFIPDQASHIDSILGVKLQGDNQYAKKIS